MKVQLQNTQGRIASSEILIKDIEEKHGEKKMPWLILDLKTLLCTNITFTKEVLMKCASFPKILVS